MPAWIHNRAEHILAKNPSMKKETAFAIATQQSHKMGKTPKGYGTAKGKREAKAKYDQPKKEYTKGANPGNLETPKLSDKPTTRWTGSKLVKKSAVPSLGWTYGMGPKLVREAASGAKEAVKSKLKKTVGSVKKVTGLEKKGALLKLGKDQIPGGKADKKTDTDFDPKQMAMGEKIEMEHTNDRAKAREIARDHLEEFGDYYTRLEKMEQQAEKAKEASVRIYSFCDEVLHLMRI
jgi:hypothetical protein